MNSKIKEWIKRYLPAEIVATFTAILISTIVYLLTKNPIITALAGTWGENLGYYGFLSIREVVQSKKQHKLDNKRYGVLSFFKNIRNLVLEFGFSEILDSFLIRPFAMYTFLLLVGNPQLGIFLGKISADIIFYIPTIIAYELRKKHLK